MNDELIPFGNFIIEKPNNTEVKEKTTFTGYDYMLKFNTKFIDNNTYPISVKDYFSNLCSQVGLEAGTETLVNEEYQILGNPFTNNEDCRTVLSAIAQLCGGFAKIGRDNKVHILNLSLDTEADTLDANNYDSSFKRNNDWGEVNSVAVKLSEDVDGEEVREKDEESIETNGLTEISIADNPFLINEEERAKALVELWTTFRGLKYTPFSTKYYGYPYLDVGDKIKVLDSSDNEHISYVFDHKFTYNGAFSGNIDTKALTKTQSQYKNTNNIKDKFRKVELKVDKINGEIQAVVEEAEDAIKQVAELDIKVDGINTKVESSETVYSTKEELEEYKKTVATEFEQTSTDFNFLFNNAIEQVNDLAGDTHEQFQEIQKYIRFVDGNIILGESGNQITLKIQNDRISFLQNSSEVAYFSNNKLYVTDGKFLNSLQLGNFAFMPRDNGSLSFGKVG